MKKQVITFGIEKKNGVVKTGRSAVYEPKTNYKGGQTKWLDDKKLIKPNRQ